MPPDRKENELFKKMYFCMFTKTPPKWLESSIPALASPPVPIVLGNEHPPAHHQPQLPRTELHHEKGVRWGVGLDNVELPPKLASLIIEIGFFVT